MNYKDYKNKVLSDPEVKKEYDSLEVEDSITRYLIEMRLKSGMSQSELADMLNTKQSAVARLEGGVGNISIQLLRKLATVFGKKLVVSFK